MEIYVEDKIDIICNMHNKKIIINDLNNRLQYRLKWSVFIYLISIDKKISEIVINNFNYIVENLYTLQILTKEKKRKIASVVRYIDFANPLKAIQIEVTSKCNFKCKHCYLGIGELQELKIDELYKIVDGAKKLGVQIICITGGEPLLRKDIKDILKYISDANIKCELFTNGFLLDEEFCDFLEQIKLNRIQISLDGHTSQVHDDFRGMKGSFDKNIKAINLLKKRNIPITVTSVLHKDNIKTVDSLVTLLDKHLRIKFKFDYIIKTGCAENKYEDIGITSEQYCEAVFEIAKDVVGNFKNYNKHFCDIGKGFIFINSNGIVKLCPSIHEEFNYGNLKKDSLEIIWCRENNKYIGIICANNKVCNHYGKCRGGCRNRGLLFNQSIDAPDTIMCELMEMIDRV